MSTDWTSLFRELGMALPLMPTAAAGWVKDWLAARGFAIFRKPRPLLACPAGELRISLPILVEYHQAMYGPEGFFFVQVGAFDGVANDPIHPLVVRHGWRGILAEPQDEPFRRLSQLYSDQPQVCLENVAVDRWCRRRTLFSVRQDREGLPAWTSQLASFHRHTITAHRAAIPDIDDLIEEREVECLTLEALLDRAGSSRLDLLQIDAEGYDAEIVRSLDFHRWRPAILRYEHKHLSRKERDECAALLLEQGYRLALEPEDTLAYRPPDERPGR